MRNQQGFGVIGIVVLLIVGALVAGGVYSWYMQQEAMKDREEYVSAPVPDQGRIVSPERKDAKEFLYIDEWKVKVRLGEADPTLVTYAISGPTKDRHGPIAAQAKVLLKDTVTPGEACRNVGVTINRRTSAERIANGNQSGGYAYDVTTATPLSCNESSAQGVRQQYMGDKTTVWEFYGSN